MLKVLLLLLLELASASLHPAAVESSTWPACSCHVSLCKPITTVPTKEIFAFHVHKPGYEYKKAINWTEITSLAVFGVPPDASEMLCFAHAHNVRVVIGVGFPKGQLNNATARMEWINRTVANVKTAGLDGINFDIEGDHSNRDGLNDLVRDTRTALHTVVGSTTQLTFDTTISPSASNRGYDFKTLATLLDFMVPMAYDMCWGTTHAEPNCPLSGLRKGLNDYSSLGISGDKIVLGLPWYGYEFPCTESSPQHGPCHVVSPFGGGGWQRAYDDILTLEKSAVIAPQYSAAKDARYFTVKTSKGYSQLWYDDPVTLATKYHIARDNHLRGVAFWYDACVSNTDPTHMWADLSAFLA